MYVLHSFRYTFVFIPVTDLWAGDLDIHVFILVTDLWVGDLDIHVFIPVTDLWVGEGAGGGTEGGRSTCQRPQQSSPPPFPTPTAKTRPKYVVITLHHIVLFPLSVGFVYLYMTWLYLYIWHGCIFYRSWSLPIKRIHLFLFGYIAHQ